MIPYQPTDPTGKRALVLAPHPDDETFGCGGTLALHANAGDPVKVVFLTNGGAGEASGKTDKSQYVRLRREEARKACACLGVPHLEFWPYEDRCLAGSRGALGRMMDLLEDFRPEIVYVPSPLEFHPDHRAVCVLFCDALCHYASDVDVAFYELGQPVRVNRLVDITGVSAQKAQAVAAYGSQLRERAYGDISVALDRYRSLTLPDDVVYAEGFSVWRSALVRKIGPFSIPFQQVHRLEPDSGEAGPLVSVIVRTQDRPKRLANAVRSITEQTYQNLEIVVVNDGGEDVNDVVKALAGGIPVTHIAHEGPKGRAAALNSGLRAARGMYLNFLDDDDILLPRHVEALLSFLQAREGKVAYSNVLSVYFSRFDGRPQDRLKEELVFNLDFDPDILLFQNYIPIMSVLFSSKVLAQVNGFCEDLDLFEDWEFWIRVSRHFRFHHLDQVTAEYRFYAVSSDEGAHREKYRYDEALAAVFDRVKPFVTGTAWVRFLHQGSMGRFRENAPEQGCQVSSMEAELAELRKTAGALGAEVEKYKNRASELEKALKGLKMKREQATPAFLEKMARIPGGRFYKRLARRIRKPVT
ncbi:MAG: PIG-L family deacetylase [Deltaproteobacteria bacterium]|nr:PIG-L family deacetylase [Deltaproteobacteria bacterium]